MSEIDYTTTLDGIPEPFLRFFTKNSSEEAEGTTSANHDANSLASEDTLFFMFLLLLTIS